jgi:hypothetical protein
MSGDAAVQGALAITDDFLSTFNAMDAVGHAATLAYPHYRFASGKVRTWDSIEQATAAMEVSMQALRDSGWDRSTWDHRDAIHVGESKVHLDMQFTRHRADGSVIGVFPAIYVVVNTGRHWLIQARSSFAP